MHNDKILDPEKHCMISCEERVGNVEQFISQYKIMDIVKKDIENYKSKAKDICRNKQNSIEEAEQAVRNFLY